MDMQGFQPDRSSLAPKLDPDRHGFAVTSLAAGFAAAVSPVAAATITTDTGGLSAGEVRIPVQDGEIPGYLAMPAGTGPFPVVLVVQEIFGVHEHIKDVCRRLAKAGYYAIAPALHARQGDVSAMSDIQQILRDVVARVPDAQVMADLDATLRFATASGQADVQRSGITGFCWGGRIVWLYTMHNPALKAGVAWYGRLVGDVNELQPRQPVDIAGELTVPVLGLYGGKDQSIPLDTVERMRTALTKGRSGSEIVVFPQAGHGFHADYRPSYDEAAAKEGWQRMLDWFKAHGAG